MKCILCLFYPYSLETLAADVSSFHRLCDKSTFDERINCFVKKELHLAYPTLAEAVKVFLCVPMSSATSERAFSTLRMLKSYLRNTIGQSRLHSLGVLQIERERKIDLKNVISKFASAKKHVLLLR